MALMISRSGHAGLRPLAQAVEKGAISLPIPHPSGWFRIGADCDYTAAGWVGFHMTLPFRLQAPSWNHLTPITQPHSRTGTKALSIRLQPVKTVRPTPMIDIY